MPRQVRLQEAYLVSIRSPHRGEGRLVPPGQTSSTWSFQSAPLTEARGDRLSPGLAHGVVCFNPLPSPRRGEIQSPEICRSGNTGFNPLPSPRRGEIAKVGRWAEVKVVSIRSPHRGEGRSAGICAFPRARNWFQSAPLTEARGDRVGEFLKRHLFRFNPLPSPRRGEMPRQVRLQEAYLVSIRSPHRGEGRLVPPGQTSSTWSFQSAPLTEARGDRLSPGLAHGVVCFNPLPSPRRGEIQKVIRSRQHFSQVSIRSPHRGEGR